MTANIELVLEMFHKQGDGFNHDEVRGQGRPGTQKPGQGQKEIPMKYVDVHPLTYTATSRLYRNVPSLASTY